jgi:hypothetical protein
MAKNREVAAREAEAQRQKIEAARLARDSQPVEVIFRVRHFETYVGEDGRKYVREVQTEAEAKGEADGGAP